MLSAFLYPRLSSNFLWTRRHYHECVRTIPSDTPFVRYRREDLPLGNLSSGVSLVRDFCPSEPPRGSNTGIIIAARDPLDRIELERLYADSVGTAVLSRVLRVGEDLDEAGGVPIMVGLDGGESKAEGVVVYHPPVLKNDHSNLEYRLPDGSLSIFAGLQPSDSQDVV